MSTELKNLDGISNCKSILGNDRFVIQTSVNAAAEATVL
jgi:hypothetical protein